MATSRTAKRTEVPGFPCRLLRERLKDSKIEREYRHYGTTTDIYVRKPSISSASEVFVELKRDPNQKPKLDQLMCDSEVQLRLQTLMKTRTLMRKKNWSLHLIKRWLLGLCC
jgi:hypothetical protein